MAALTNSGEEILNSSVVVSNLYEYISYTKRDIPEVYSIGKCISWIKKHSFKHVFLQFTEEFSKDAPRVCLCIQMKVNAEVTITYCSNDARCCVETKNAEYAKMLESNDCIIKFGHSCLTSVPSKPVLRIFSPNWVVNKEIVVQKLLCLAKDNPGQLVLLYDTRCAYAVGDIESTVNKELSDVQVSKLIGMDNESNVKNGCACNADYSAGICSLCTKKLAKTKTHLLCEAFDSETTDDGPKFYRLHSRLLQFASTDSIKSAQFVYLGRAGSTISSLALQCPQISFNIVDPITGESSVYNPTKIIMQRNHKIEQIKNTERIGILISNSNLPNVKDIYLRLSTVIRSAGKKPRIVHSSSPDVAKLSNYGLSIFIYIACSESTLIERNMNPDLYKFLATPWELEVALNPNQKWRLSFETNCAEILEGGFCYQPLPSEKSFTQGVSLLTNKMQSVGIAEEEIETVMPVNSKTGAVVAKTTQELQKIQKGFSSGLLWGEKQWYGLDPSVESPHPIGEVVMGKKGVAAGYDSEPKLSSE